MGKLTKMITYNVHDRGRKARGVDRHFDTVALAKLVNGSAVQERVRKGDMLGYLGHWPRLKFGMAVTEGGMLDGKAVALPVAVRQVHLSADEQGNITHQMEFLDTHEGKLAERMYDSGAGGFSTAIDAVPRSNPSIPIDWHGADFVFEPNYDSNRGYRAVLDSVGEEERDDVLAIMDAAAAESTTAFELFDAVQAQLARALEALESVSAENDLLIGRLASGKTGMLDDIMGEGGRIAPTGPGVTQDFDKYRTMPLVDLQRQRAEHADRSDDAVILRRLGMRD